MELREVGGIHLAEENDFRMFADPAGVTLDVPCELLGAGGWTIPVDIPWQVIEACWSRCAHPRTPEPLCVPTRTGGRWYVHPETLWWHSPQDAPKLSISFAIPPAFLEALREVRQRCVWVPCPC